jgi:Trk-type K+ transport system membrane component
MRAFIHCDIQSFPIIFLIYVHVQTQNMQKMVFKNKIVITKIIFGNIKFSIIMDLNTDKISKRNTTKNFDMVKRKIIINNSKLIIMTEVIFLLQNNNKSMFKTPCNCNINSHVFIFNFIFKQYV